MSMWSEIVFGNREWINGAAIAGVLLAILTLWSYRKSAMPWSWRPVAILLRLLGIALLLLCLLEPLGSTQRPKSQANVFAILMDNSQSMGILLRGDDESNAREQVAESDPISRNTIDDRLSEESDWQRKLADDFRLRRYLFDSSTEPVDTFAGRSSAGKDSALYQALQSLSDRYQGQPLAGVLLITDGNATDRKPEQDLSSLGVPVYPVRMGTAIQKRDVRIDSATTRQSDFETSPVTLLANVTHRGFVGESVTVELRNADQKVMQTQTIKLKGDNVPVPVEFRFRPEKGGVQGFQIFAKRDAVRSASDAKVPYVDPIEVTLGNNSRFQVVDRGRGPYRILYLAGRPNWEFKFLKRALDEDDEIRLTSLIRIARKEPKFSFRDSKIESSNPLFSGFEDIIDEEKEQYDEPVFARLGVTQANQLQKGFPKDAEELFEYSAVIIDDLEHEFLSQDQQLMLRQFVSSRGGGLMMLGGQESMRGKGFSDSVLSQLLPFYGDDSPLPSDSGPFTDDEPTIRRYQLTREGWLQPFLRLADNEEKERERLAQMPNFEVLNKSGRIKPGAAVMAEVVTEGGEHFPVFVSQRFGKGRTAGLMIGDMWRWALRHDRPGSSPLFQSWRQMVRWMIADVPRSIQMQMLPSLENSRVANLFVQVKGADFQSVDNALVKISVTSPTGKSTTIDAEPSMKIAGHYTATMVTEEEGVYSALAEVAAGDGSKLGSAQIGWVYQPTASELQSLGENLPVLQSIAEETGGKIVEWNRLSDFVANVPTQRVPVTETRIYPLWHQAWVLLAAIGCLCGEWGMRRRYGMV